MGALEWVGAIGDLVAAPFNMIGNIYAANKNYKAQQQANETNIQIAREQNEYNKEMYEDQKEFTWEMWNATNEYNSAKNQRARLIEAGYNPNVLASAGNAGIATGSSAPSAQPAAGANVQAPQLPMNMFQLPQLGSMFLNFKNLSEENKSKQLDNKRKSIENSYLAFEKYWALEKLKGEAKSAYARQVIDNVQASYAGDMAALDFEGKQFRSDIGIKYNSGV